MNETSAVQPLNHEPVHTGPSFPVTFWQAFRVWLKIGLIGFGGPTAQIIIMHRELVEVRRWISEKRFLHALNYCMLLPGPEGQQLATYMGWLMHRTRGGIAAGILFLLPGLLFLIAMSWLYIAFGKVPLVAGLFYGIKPAVVAVVIHAVHRIGARVLKNSAMWLIAAASFIAIFIFHAPFPAIVATAAAIGFIGGRLSPQLFRSGGSHGSKQRSYGPAFIDDDTPPFAHTQFSWSGLVKVLLVGTLLWSVPMATLTSLFGWQHTLTQMGWFFTKAALLTFGGAYAVLPYINQAAVGHYGWLTPGQMIDGLALGEANPGPLIMVVAFVGFVGGYGQTLFGPDMPFLAGAVAAVLVTWFTFLPSFIFILGGGPLVESTHNNLSFTAPLAAITAAVVGVILNLALFFAQHVLWPQGFAGSIDWLAVGMTLLAAIALVRFKRSIIQVIGVSALIGLMVKWFFA